MSKKGGSQTVSTAPDAQAQDWMRRTQAAAESAGTGAPTDAARQFYQNMIPSANLGMSALTGDAAATSQLMNPFMAQVMDRYKSGMADANALTSRGINDEATKAGAFGGSRHGVAEGVALAQNGKTFSDQSANLLYGGYGDAMNRANGLVNFGMGAAGAMPGLDPSTMRFRALQQAGAGMPWGQTTTQPLHRNPVAGALGGALGLGQMFGGKDGANPWAAGIGGLLGMFL